jgi:hypothetical protein
MEDMMANLSRMPNYDIRNDGVGPYAIFYCESCNREFRSTPDVGGTVAQDLGKQALGGLLRKVPLLGHTVADNLTGAQLESAWKQVQAQFRECPTCARIVCLSDFDTQSGFCNEDSPRTGEISEARGEQAGAALKGFASAFGLGEVMKKVNESVESAQKAAAQAARCPKDGTLAPPGTKFCPECGGPMVTPESARCPSCGAETHNAKFCPECGTKIEARPALTNCPSCGAETKGAKFCPECGTKLA